ncbi:UNVERIFIED_CONTAM: hypothetical protein Cloal_3716 [Acetivibrio alkalicellulosi]
MFLVGVHREKRNVINLLKSKKTNSYFIYPLAGITIMIILAVVQIGSSSFQTLIYEVSETGGWVIGNSPKSIVEGIKKAIIFD